MSPDDVDIEIDWTIGDPVIVVEVPAAAAAAAADGSTSPTEVATATALGRGEHGLRCGLVPQVIIDEYTPRVSCVVCKQDLDPVDVLRSFAKRERNFAFQLDDLRAEKIRLTSEVAALKQQRANLRRKPRSAT